MADLSAIVPYQDPADDIIFIDESSFLVENPTLDLPQCQLSKQPIFQPPEFESASGFDNINVDDINDPMADPAAWEMCCGSDGNLVIDYPVQPFGFQGEGSSHFNGNNNPSNHPENLDSLSPMQFSDSPVFPSPDSCICCHKLREITHVNGISMKRLVIYGRVGVIVYAIFEKYSYDYGSSSQNHEFKVFDFFTESIQRVKQFLVQYCEDCKQEGYVMLQDPLSTFYEAISIGANDGGNSNEFLQFSPEVAGQPRTFDPHSLNSVATGYPSQVNQQETPRPPKGERNLEESVKIPLAVQRARTGSMNVKDVIAYFDLPSDRAAKRLNICPTVLKKICRKGGLKRWPYRKIRSLKGKISEKKKILTCMNGGNGEREQAQADIRMYQQELDEFYGKFISNCAVNIEENY